MYCVYESEDSVLFIKSVFPTLNYRVGTITITFPKDVLVEIEKAFLKFPWKCKGPKIAKTTPKKNKVREVILPDLMIYCKTVDIRCLTLGSRLVNKETKYIN